nr:unnamed protein product [Callosobruchus chinensis]
MYEDLLGIYSSIIILYKVTEHVMKRKKNKIIIN